MENTRRMLLSGQNLGKGLRNLRDYVDAHGLTTLGSRLEDLENDYRLMLDYMRRGFRDEQRDALYTRLLRRAYRLSQDADLAERLRHGSYSSARYYGDKVSLLPADVRARLEHYVQETALASLEGRPAETVETAQQQYRAALFSAILVAPQWNDGMREAWTALLLSPTIDLVDAQLLVSALTLGAMNVFDANKWRVLADVFAHAEQEELRQRALVGWVLSLPTDDIPLLREVEEQAAALCADEQVARQMLELQMQLFYCNNADADHEELQRDILPTLMRNNRFRMTGNGIVETEDDPMRDILDPGAEDREMEELEQSVQRMVNMQNAGADIYFGGFSHMKNFPFFNELSHWFLPFYAAHPALASVAGMVKESPFLQLLFAKGPFCDSDKYSFALAFGNIARNMPKQMMEALNSGEAVDGALAEESRQRQPAYLRRKYLQDLYRFFRLYARRADFVNPFALSAEQPLALFFVRPVLVKTALGAKVKDLLKFLYKRKHRLALETLLNAYPEQREPDGLLVKALVRQQHGAYREAKEAFLALLEMEPGHERALKGVAQACFQLADYAEAARCYQRLSLSYPDNYHYLLNAAISLMNDGQTEEGVRLLYQLDFEHPGEVAVQRALAWGHLAQANAEKAWKIYETLLGQTEPAVGDFLHAAYAQWFRGQVEQAVELFRRYLDKACQQDAPEDLLTFHFADDRALLRANGVRSSEEWLMCELVLRG